ncbi:MAG: ATP-binding protein [Spartobacteria bacterium]
MTRKTKSEKRPPPERPWPPLSLHQFDLATLSHELRTPLNAMFGWTQLMKSGRHEPELISEGIEVIDRNVRVQTDLIEDLLDMSRVISGKLRLDVQHLDPGRAIDAAIETVTPAAEAKGIRIKKILDSEAGPISGDPGRVQQIFGNLLSNAIKFTRKGGKVQVLLERVNSHLEITVADTGQGIEAEFLPYVFDRFRQADGSANRRHGGLGLGLAIAKQLVVLHGGSIRAESEGRGQGTSFIVSLPVKVMHAHLDPSERRHPATPSAAPGYRKCTDLAGLKILVVDDERDARELLRRMLINCEAEVLLAASAGEALSLVDSQVPDILISDIGMAEVDGYEFLRKLRTRELPNGRKTPAIALTAFARSEDRTKALLAGFSAHISKPVEPSELIATIASVIGRTIGHD